MTLADIHNIAGYYSSQPHVQSREEAKHDLPNDSAYLEGAESAAVCVDCHGEGGFSEEPGVPSLAGQQAAYLIVSIQEYARGERGHQEKEAMLREMEQVDIEKMALYFASQVPPAREAPSFGDPDRGEPLTASCGECHGANGVSHDPLVPSLAGQQPDYLVKAIRAYREGERQHEEMVADRTDLEIDDIAAFYAVQRPVSAGGQRFEVQELAAKCDRCHNPVTGPSALTVPSLEGQNREYLVRVMKAYRDNDRGNSMMHKMSAGYSDAMIEAIADHYSSQ
jgi:cytochrome c553